MKYSGQSWTSLTFASKPYFLFQATTEEFRKYQEQAMKNAKVMSNELIKRGYDVVSSTFFFILKMLRMMVTFSQGDI